MSASKLFHTCTLMEGRGSEPRLSFGDGRSSIVDEFERLTCEIELHKMMLRRSFSSPCSNHLSHDLVMPPPILTTKLPPVRAKQNLGFLKLLKKVMKTMRLVGVHARREGHLKNRISKTNARSRSCRT